MQSQMQRKERRGNDFSFTMRLGIGSTCSPWGPVSYLGGVRDLWTMGLVNKDMSTVCRQPEFLKKLISRNWTRVMESTGTGIDPDEFSTLLQSHQCIVAGAFALQCVTGDYFETYTSVDQRRMRFRHRGPNMQVYCTTSGYKEVLHYLEHHGYTRQRALNSSIAECTISPMCHRGTRHSVDLVRMCPNLQPKHAVSQFDYSFVASKQNSSSGHNVSYWYCDSLMARIIFSSEVPLCYAFIM